MTHETRPPTAAPISSDASVIHAPSRVPQWLQMLPLPKRHWSPRYIVNRLRLAMYQRKHPDHPWLTRDMIEFLDGYLRPAHMLVEFGSGRSTVWFARRVGHILSIEQHKEWHRTVTQTLTALGRDNFTYLHVGETPEEYLAPATEHIARLSPDGKADVILVDGIHRDHCALWALGRVRAGGLIVVDNVNWFLPHETRAPSSVGAHGKPHTALWEQFWSTVRAWKTLWTSNGVTDTAAFRPPA